MKVGSELGRLKLLSYLNLLNQSTWQEKAAPLLD